MMMMMEFICKHYLSYLYGANVEVFLSYKAMKMELFFIFSFKAALQNK